MRTRVRAGHTGEGAALHELAAATFHDACPPGVDRATSTAHVLRELSAQKFEDWLAQPQSHVLVLEQADQLVGYAVVMAGRPIAISGHLSEAELADEDTLWFLSKFYVMAQSRGSGAAQLLMDAVISTAQAAGATGLWLTVNQLNPRANAFYQRNGLRAVGTSTFPMGEDLHQDHVRLLRWA